MNIRRLFFQVLLLCVGSSLASAEDDVIVPEGFRLLENARLIADDDIRTAQLHGKDFDHLVKAFYKKLEQDGIAKPITRTFAGDEIANGWRIGNKEIWLQKQTPALGTSLDIIIWDLEMDKDGNVTAARGTGMDHHTVHPDSPRATATHKKHWEEKKTTAQFWENSLKKRRPDINVTLDMNPDNSFYWREAADRPEVDEFTRERSRRAADRHGHQLGHSVFVGTAVKTLGGTMAAVNAATAGLALIDALKKVYESPVLAKTFALLQEGKYRQARNYWEAHVINDTSSSAEFDDFRKALAEATSVLSARTYTEFPEAMRLLFEKWESDAKQVFGEPVLEPGRVIHLGDGNWTPTSENGTEMKKELLLGPTWKTDFSLENREFTSAELIFGEVKGVRTGGRITINSEAVGRLNARGRRVSVWIGGAAALKQSATNTIQIDALVDDRTKDLDDFEFNGVWIKLIPRESDPTVGGKYSDLLHKISCPEDKSSHGEFEDWSDGGRTWERTEYQDYTDLKPGYWVWVYPHWYVWAKSTESN